ncbi:hypothetical protein, conserved [Angomonas deanei]|uniref:Uncharacterized protein n=1 Tax=Angomonas deanei TaxID=59799 RepID=A0A7G2CLI2_9TRYP|nr:hypothetical protein, conserved [Angomonas deanei]
MAALGTCMTNMENTLLQKDEEIEKLKKKLSLSEKKTARESQASEQVAHLQEQVQQQTDEVRRKMHRILLLEQENDVLKEELSRRDGFVASTTSNQQFIVNLLESLKRTAMDLKQTSCPSKAHKDDDGEGERVSPAPRRTVRPRSLSRLSKSVGATVKSAGTARRSSSRRTRNQEQDDSLLSVSHLNSSMVAIIKEIESALEATKRTISTKSETHAIHLREQQQIGELVEKYKTLAETLSEREKELSDLQTECNLRGQDLDALEKYVSAQNHKMSASLKLVEEWKEKATSLGDELAAVKSTVIEHESYVDKLKADLEEAQKKHADMNKDLETKCAAVLEAEGRVDALRKQLDNETKKGEELLAAKEKDNLRLQEEKKTLEEECGRLQKLVDSFTEQQNTLDNRFDLERKELTSHLHSLRDSCDLLQRKLQSCSKCMKDSMFELSLAQSGEVETLNSLLDILGTPHSAIVQNAPSYRAGAAVSPSDSPEKFMNSCRRDTQFIAELRRSVISRARQIVHNGGAAASSPSRTPVRESPLQGAPPTSMSNTREEYFDDYFGGRTPTVKSLFLAEREPSPSPRLLPYSSSKANRKRLSLTNASPTSAYGLSQSKSRQEGAVDGSVSPARPPVLSEAFRL